MAATLVMQAGSGSASFVPVHCLTSVQSNAADDDGKGHHAITAAGSQILACQQQAPIQRCQSMLHRQACRNPGSLSSYLFIIIVVIVVTNAC